MLLFAALGILWGIPYLLIRVSVEAVSPATLVFARTAVGALLLLPVALSRGQMSAVLRRWRWVLIYTAVEIGLPWLMLSTAEQRITSSLSGLLVAAVPLVGAAIARRGSRRDRLGPAQLAGLLVGVLGVALVLGSDLGGLTAASGAEMAVVVVCYATGPQIIARRLADLPSLQVVAVSLAVCSLGYLPVFVALHPARVPAPGPLAAILTLGVVCTAVAFLVMFALIAEVGAVRATVVTYVNPAVAVILGVWVLGEPFHLGMGAGFALILVGSVFSTRVSRPRPPLAPARAGAAGA
ncbi:MAG: DMT family transporter [Candidatus Dormibacteria bacterium]